MSERKRAAASAMLLQRRKRSGASRHVFYWHMTTKSGADEGRIDDEGVERRYLQRSE
jgi:hypothetical protein